MCVKELKKCINFTLCFSNKKKNYIDPSSCYEMTTVISVKKDDEYSIAFANLLDGGLDYSDLMK
jgi:hypothetical protein